MRSLPKPNIPEPESYDIDEVDSMDIQQTVKREEIDMQGMGHWQLTCKNILNIKQYQVHSVFVLNSKAPDCSVGHN